MTIIKDLGVLLTNHRPLRLQSEGVQRAVQENTAVAFTGTTKEEGCSIIVMPQV